MFQDPKLVVRQIWLVPDLTTGGGGGLFIAVRKSSPNDLLRLDSPEVYPFQKMVDWYVTHQKQQGIIRYAGGIHH